MAEESDGIAETLEGGVQLAATAAVQAVEVAARLREAQLRQQTGLEQERLTQLRQRVTAEMATARATPGGGGATDVGGEQRTYVGHAARRRAELDAIQAAARARREQGEAAAVLAGERPADLDGDVGRRREFDARAHRGHREAAEAVASAPDLAQPASDGPEAQAAGMAQREQAQRKEQGEAVALLTADAAADRVEQATEQTTAASVDIDLAALDPTAALGFDDGYGVGYGHGLETGRGQVLDELGLFDLQRLTPYDERTAQAARQARAELNARYTAPAADPRWDTHERRAQLADDLTARGLDADAVQARVLADTSQALPAAEAVRAGVRAKARPARGPAAGAEQVLDR